MFELNAPSAQRGLSLVELLVGAALGMFIVGGAITLFVSSASGSRHLLVEARVNQDLRTAADLIARDLRRAGFWGHAITTTAAAAPPANPFGTVTVTTPALNEITYAFDRNGDDTLDANEQFGFHLDEGEIKMRTSSDRPWQPITDGDVVEITNFTITSTETPVSVGQACAKACPPPAWETYTCPAMPTLTLRRYDILIQGHAVSDPSVTRQLQETVRVRNDVVQGACPS